MKASEYCDKYFVNGPLTKEDAAKMYIEVFHEVFPLVKTRKNPKSAIKEINQKWNSIVSTYNNKYPQSEFGLKRNAIWNDFASDLRLQLSPLPES